MLNINEFPIAAFILAREIEHFKYQCFSKSQYGDRGSLNILKKWFLGVLYVLHCRFENKYPPTPNQTTKPQANCSAVFDPLHQAELDMHRLATNFILSKGGREQLFEQQTECFLLQIAILSPELL